MSRRTVDFGIDLGTTNSAITLMEHGQAKVLKNFKQSEITPSVVRIDENGSVIVGQSAYNRLYTDRENTFSAFKLLMGTRQTKTFSRSGRVLKPEELSAEVLKDLKATVRLRLPDEPDLTAAVITVPCYFEMTQSQATSVAAKLAGIEFAPLLQEPIAASIAYGFMEKMPKGYWIVYDLGGGTFDVALLSAKDGHLVVVDHDGDNYLGGGDFDWRIVEEIIYPVLRETYHLPGLGRNLEYGLLNAVLKYAAEEAKINLSQSEKTEIIVEEMESLKDHDGKRVALRIAFNRQQLNAVIGEDVEKSMRLFRNLLKNQKLAAADVGHLILVGGPTQIPYIRERLKDEFQIPINYSVDPMTVVAKGAAIYASCQLLAPAMIPTDNKAVSVQLNYEPMTTALQVSVAGKIVSAKDKPLPSGMKLQIRTAAGDWQSGMIEIRDGVFFTSLLLHPNGVNTFILALFDQNANQVPVDCDSFSINQGMSVGAPPLARSIGVELHDGTFDRLLAKGVSLPVKASYTYHAAKDIHPGQEQEAIEIPVREGESDRFDLNRHLGTLVIRGTDIGRKIPVNADVEVTIFVDQSRSVSAEAFIPVLDQKFSMKIPNMTSPLPESKDFPLILDRQEKRWKEIQQKAASLKISLAQAAVLVNGYFTEINREIKAVSSTDPIVIEKVDRRLKELQEHLDAAGKLVFWPALLQEYKQRFADAMDTVENFAGNVPYLERLNLLKKDADKAVALSDSKRLNKVLEDINDLKWEILFRQKDFWIGAFQELRQKEPEKFINPKRAHDLLEEGGRALLRQDTESVQSITIELWKLISSDEQAHITQAVNSRSGIKRKKS